MNILKWILIGVAVGTALYFVVVGIAYALAITLAKFTPAHPIEEWLPHPDTGKPILAKGTLRFGARLPALLYACSGHWYAQTLAWPTKPPKATKREWTPTVCLPDNDVEGETLYHELLIHGMLQWLKYKFRFLPLQFRAVVLHSYRGSKVEEHAYDGGEKWKDVAPSYRLDPPTALNPYGVLVKFYRNEAARRKWEQEHAILPRAA